MTNFTKALSILAFICFSLSIKALDTWEVSIDPKKQVQDISHSFGFLEDSLFNTPLEDVRNKPKSDFFFFETSKPIYFDHQSNPQWIKSVLRNNSDEAQEFFIEVHNANIYDAHFYLQNSDGSFTKKYTGDKYPYSKLDYKFRNPLFKLRFEPNEVKEIYVHLDNKKYRWDFPFKVWNKDHFVTFSNNLTFAKALFYGLMILILVINIYIMILGKRKVVLYYFLYVLSLGIYNMIKDGYAKSFLYPEVTGINTNLISFTILTSIIFNVRFFQNFLSTKIYSKYLHRYLNVLAAGAFVLLPFAFFDSTNSILLSLNTPFIEITTFSVLIGSLSLFNKANRLNAISYFIGYLVLVCSVVLTILFTHGYIDGGIWKYNILKVGTAMEIVIFTIAIVNSFQREQRDIHIKALEKQAELDKKISASEMKALRAQMNPHFTFNIMNSIQHFLTQSDIKSSVKYLSKFSRLMRKILEHSKVGTIPLSEELETIQLYLELEALRFEDKFTYEIDLCEELTPEDVKIPSMLIQPFVENAIWHGLMHKENEKGHITIKINLENNILICSIIDNGIGRKESIRLKAEKPKEKKSLGMKITKERLDILKEITGQELSFDINDLTNPDQTSSGTEVVIKIPQI